MYSNMYSFITQLHKYRCWFTTDTMASSITIKINKSQLCFHQINLIGGGRGGSVCFTGGRPYQQSRGPRVAIALTAFSIFYEWNAKSIGTNGRGGGDAQSRGFLACIIRTQRGRSTTLSSGPRQIVWRAGERTPLTLTAAPRRAGKRGKCLNWWRAELLGLRTRRNDSIIHAHNRMCINPLMNNFSSKLA